MLHLPQFTSYICNWKKGLCIYNIWPLRKKMLKTKEICIISNSHNGRHLVTNSLQEKKTFLNIIQVISDIQHLSMTATWRPLSYANFPIIPCHWALFSDWPVLCFSPPGAEQRRGLCSQYHSSQTHLSSFLGKSLYPPMQSFWVCLRFSFQWVNRCFCCTLHYPFVLCDVYDIFVKSAMTSCRDHFILKQFCWGCSSSGKEEEKQHILWKLVLFCVMDEPTVGTQDVVKTDKGWSFRICSTI